MPATTAMPDSLIINVPHRLRWHQRLVSGGLTALLWGIWLWLWEPLLHALHWMRALDAPAAPSLDVQGMVSLEQSVFALVATAATLLLWRLVPARRAQLPGDAPTLQGYASHFGLPVETLQAGRNAATCIVHHDEHGHIVRLEPRPRA
jgi:poly-beta-1,6-N-acetyl-D-glucosamine biosynthesis protein PgaD